MLNTPNGSNSPARRPHDRRLFYLVLSAFNQASDQHDGEATQGLLNILTGLVSSSDRHHEASPDRDERSL